MVEGTAGIKSVQELLASTVDALLVAHKPSAMEKLTGEMKVVRALYYNLCVF